MKITAAFTACAAALLLAACASKPPVPSWQPNAKDALDGFTDDYLRGNTSAADAEFARARRETTSTGRADLVAQVELVRCATLAASLEFDDCPGFAALAGDATARQRAYAAYIAGRWDGLDVAALPEQHRPVVASGSMAGVADPLSRLVAAGALFKAGRIRPEEVKAAAETASNQGWRRPLLTWLGVQLRRDEAAGNMAAADSIRRRIALASGEK
ncbi:hypothetical protein [Massilia sp. GCM10023247]|uniref:hypothetical protein n=1 Tax=Massilia sp. GCM10023247 TaxID=3252643 RepID=UPI00361D459F